MATKEPKVTMADIKKAFWRYVFFSQCGWNYERMQSVGYCYSMLPIFKKTRPDPEEFKEAFITNLNFYNTNPILGTPLIMGAHIALEEAGASFDTTEGLKVGLMGPLAGVGDTLVWALYNSIIFSICSSMALAGNALGPILAMILVFFPYMALRWWQITWAYKQGSNLMASIGGGAIGRITEFATIVGLVVIGGFAPSIVHLVTPLAYSQNITVGGETATQTVSVQAQLDAVLPYMLPALVIFLAYWLLKKKGWSPVKVIMLLVVLGFLGGAFGIFG
jgi:PTS system mannose-specific IID component